MAFRINDLAINIAYGDEDGPVRVMTVIFCMSWKTGACTRCEPDLSIPPCVDVSFPMIVHPEAKSLTRHELNELKEQLISAISKIDLDDAAR